MTNEQLTKFSTIIDAMNLIEVKGRQNLLQLGGCISMLMELRDELAQEVTEETEEK